MSKKRKEIRNEVVSVIKKAQVVKPENLRAQRSTVYENNRLPAISVYTRVDEVLSELSSAPRILKKNIEVAIEIVLKDDHDDTAADKLDDICEKIEEYLESDVFLNGKANDLILKRTDFDFIGEKVDDLLHSAIMVFDVNYNDYAPRDRFLQPQVPFEGINAQYSVGHDNAPPDMVEADRAKDNLDLPQS